jgi:hypothetical protein
MTESDIFIPLGLAVSEKQIPEITENTVKSKYGMELLESVGPRPWQARYQAALSPDPVEFLFQLIFALCRNDVIAAREICLVRT